MKLALRLSRSRLENFKPLANFDWNWPTAIGRPLVESIASLDFLESARSHDGDPTSGAERTPASRGTAKRPGGPA